MPSTFHSSETGNPFSHCCDCGGEFLEADADAYIVNKSYVGEECVFELALCLPCREKMQRQLSEESRVAMFDFMHDHIDMEAREAKFDEDSDVSDFLAECVTCHQPKNLTNNYTIGGMLYQNELLKENMPMLICGVCEESLSETISDETRKVWDNFIEEHFPGPPSEVKLPSGSKPVLI